MNDNDVCVIFRFSEYRWIESFVKGELSFSCAANYIIQAKNSDNNIQGDSKEAVFARFKENDGKIIYYKNLLGRDLEIIPDGQYVLLRRKRAKYKPIFCFYQYMMKDAYIDGGFSKEGYATIKHQIDDKIFTGFSKNGHRINGLNDDRQPTSIAVNSKPFFENVIIRMVEEKYEFDIQTINYEFMNNETYEIPLSNDYNELFYKSPQYGYQHEGRIVIKNIDLNSHDDRKSIFISAFNKQDYQILSEPFDLKLNVITKNFKEKH